MSENNVRLVYIAARVRALIALGWSWQQIADALGISVLQAQYLATHA